ncbi:MAG: polyribonucleotide nucleotidyltransferase [Elusimicrobia bacterium]|nr:polyribonucleotide nucleotidyltransferase [Elusimicrobiota bacterium]MBU2615337.1 polyribonucleotide nucleotidyltransferase [Elusimicrobiota bacterium]
MKKEIEIGGKKVTLETGTVAKQSDGAVIAKMGETTVLVTAVMSERELPFDRQGDFVPLTVDYRERTYAGGKIPGGFFKREGRPREKETLACRLIDRSIRSIFPLGFQNELQVTVIVLSSDTMNDTDVISVIGASTALMISDIPFDGPIACVKVGMIDGQYIFNPTYEEQTKSSLDLVISGTGEKVLMLEMGAKEVSEKVIIDALEAAKPVLKQLCDLQKDLQKSEGKPKKTLKPAQPNQELCSDVKNIVKDKIKDFVKFEEIYKQALEGLKKKFGSEPEMAAQIKVVFERIYRDEIRTFIMATKKRPDGRSTEQIRDISCLVSFLPRLHGSALFTRGQTQALATVTLGTPSDMQIMEELEGEFKERFLLHYNFPGFATGETKMDRGPSRRDIGHGALAKRALYPILPNDTDFPYTIRVVSDILESNGSSSMASVCSGSLALFDAGVPMKSAVAGVSIGLITEGDKYLLLTDIQGLEDHIGDMDFKVAGTKNGITAIQLDLKLAGVETSILAEALERSAGARTKILEIMNKELDAPRSNLSAYAPRMLILQIPQSKIGGLIGPGGKNIRQILEETGTQIDIEDDGRVFISSTDEKGIDLARQRVEALTAEVEIGKIYKGKVVKIMDFGAFVEVIPGKEGLVHISQLDEHRVNKVTDICKEGDEMIIKALEIDNQGRLVLSRKAALKK